MLMLGCGSRQCYILGPSGVAERYCFCDGVCKCAKSCMGSLTSEGWLASFIVLTKLDGVQDWNGRHVPMQHSANGASAHAPAAQPELQPVAALQGS